MNNLEVHRNNTGSLKHAQSLCKWVSNFFVPRLLCGVAILSMTIFGVTPAGADLRSGSHVSGPMDRELDLLNSLHAVRDGRLDDALAIVERLTRADPNFRLAQLIRGDLLMAKGRGIGRFGAGAKENSAKWRAFVDEVRVRMLHRTRHPGSGDLPASLIQLSSRHKRAIVADVTDSRLYLFENRNGFLTLADDFYVTSGRGGPFKQVEGDLKTPIGVYFVTSRISSKQLPELYGAGALPLDYPNEWDQRLGRTGYGIWLHGVPSSTYNRAPRATEGCLALPNDDFLALSGLAEVGDERTPVIIVNRIDWISRAGTKRRSEAINRSLHRWRQDWESLDFDRYAQHYSSRFHVGALDYRAWLSRKRRVNATKRFIRVGLREVSVFAYPGEPNLRIVSFEQVYESSNLNDRSRKKQYWQKEVDGVWRIIYEGNV